MAGRAAAVQAAALGMSAGGLTGGYFGMIRDLMNLGVDADVLDKVSAELSPGKTAVVAAIDEGWTAPLNTKMRELGGLVLRKPRIEVIDGQIQREIELENAELDALEKEFADADAEAQAVIQENIDAIKKQISDTKERASARLNELQGEFEARQRALDDQIAKAVDEAKAKFQKRKAELEADYNERSAKLKKAAELAVDALG